MTTDQLSVERIALRRVPRRRGVVSGLLLFLLGAWGAIAPFVGPYFHYGYPPMDTWHWTAARGWLEVLPGAGAALMGLMMMVAASRIVVLVCGCLAAAAGAWFVVGPTLADPLNLVLGQPTDSRQWMRIIEQLGMFSALGVLIVFVAAIAVGRVSLRSIGDLKAAERSLVREEPDFFADRAPFGAPADMPVPPPPPPYGGPPLGAPMPVSPMGERQSVLAPSGVQTTRPMSAVRGDAGVSPPADTFVAPPEGFATPIDAPMHEHELLGDEYDGRIAAPASSSDAADVRTEGETAAAESAPVRAAHPDGSTESATVSPPPSEQTERTTELSAVEREGEPRIDRPAE
jgi:hypothetical protein